MPKAGKGNEKYKIKNIKNFAPSSLRGFLKT